MGSSPELFLASWAVRDLEDSCTTKELGQEGLRLNFMTEIEFTGCQLGVDMWHIGLIYRNK